MKRDAIAYLILFANIILLVAGQTLFKLSLQKTGCLNWMKVASSLPIISGLGLYVIASGLWFVVLSRLPLSIAYPLQSIAYVFAIFVAWECSARPSRSRVGRVWPSFCSGFM